MRDPSASVANASMPRSSPVSCPLDGRGSVGTSVHEIATYLPSASLEMVTVLGVPSSGRLQWTLMRPILDRTREPLSIGGDLLAASLHTLAVHGILLALCGLLQFRGAQPLPLRASAGVETT